MGVDGSVFKMQPTIADGLKKTAHGGRFLGVSHGADINWPACDDPVFP